MKPNKKNRKFNAEPILRELAEMRKSIPHLDKIEPRRTGDGRQRSTDGGIEPRTAEEFEYAALADALQSLADDVSAAVDHAKTQAMEAALRIYYAAEDLARDPEHAHLIPHVQQMREAYERDYGRPIPPKAG